MPANKLRIGLVALGAAAMLAFSVLAVRQFADTMLRLDAAEKARVWAANLVANVDDLPNILAGAMPSDESVVFFEQAKLVGDVWQLKLYGRDGRLEVVSNQLGRTHGFDESRAIRDSAALAALRSGSEVVVTREGRSIGEPAFLAEATVPIVARGHTIGFLTVIADETARQTQYVGRAGALAGTIGLIVLVAFGVPAVGYLHRTRQKEMVESRLEHLSFYDSLTGLKNSGAIKQFLADQIDGAAGGRPCLAVHFVDLDRFKETNDTHGHDTGDVVLREVAARLARVVAGEGEIGRVGGDEFLIVQFLSRKGIDPATLAGRVVEALSRPIETGNAAVDIGASVGFSLFPEHAASASNLLRAADVALYAAKSSGRGCHRMFHADMDQAFKRRKHVEARIQSALVEDGFALHFQPQFNLATGKLEGFEALLRLTDTAGGMISPGEFIPVAEEIGAICAIGNWVLREGCRSLSVIPAPMKLALNLSPAQFETGDIVGEARGAIAATGADPRRIELEITESLLLKHSAGLCEKVDGLRALGFSIVLDDFGAGYSSLSYLCRYPFDKIKIDRSFVSALGSNHAVGGIIETILELGRKLSMRVTAEGVETEEQATGLRAMRCDQVQGYLFGKPMPMNDLLVLVLREVSGEGQPKAGMVTSAA